MGTFSIKVSNEQFLTPRQAGDALQLNPRTIVKLIGDGELIGVKFGGSWRLPRDQFVKYVEEKTNEINEQADTL